MKRSASLLLVVLALASTAAFASTGPEPVTGTVKVGVASPTPARTLYNSSTTHNGLAGYVFALPTFADGKTYTLKRVSGPTGLENLDVYFYSSLTSDTGACDVGADIKETGDTETGTICPSPGQMVAYAIVVIKAGANTSFSFSFTLS